MDPSIERMRQEAELILFRPLRKTVQTPPRCPPLPPSLPPPVQCYLRSLLADEEATIRFRGEEGESGLARWMGDQVQRC
jgi:hypothetical protein